MFVKKSQIEEVVRQVDEAMAVSILALKHANDALEGAERGAVEDSVIETIKKLGLESLFKECWPAEGFVIEPACSVNGEGKFMCDTTFKEFVEQNAYTASLVKYMSLSEFEKMFSYRLKSQYYGLIDKAHKDLEKKEGE